MTVVSRAPTALESQQKERPQNKQMCRSSRKGKAKTENNYSRRVLLEQEWKLRDVVDGGCRDD